MKPTKDELLDIIYQSLDEVNEQLPSDQLIQKSLDTTLVGRAGGLDSSGFRKLRRPGRREVCASVWDLRFVDGSILA